MSAGASQRSAVHWPPALSEGVAEGMADAVVAVVAGGDALRGDDPAEAAPIDGVEGLGAAQAEATRTMARAAARRRNHHPLGREPDSTKTSASLI